MSDPENNKEKGSNASKMVYGMDLTSGGADTLNATQQNLLYISLLHEQQQMQQHHQLTRDYMAMKVLQRQRSIFNRQHEQDDSMNSTPTSSTSLSSSSTRGTSTPISRGTHTPSSRGAAELLMPHMQLLSPFVAISMTQTPQWFTAQHAISPIGGMMQWGHSNPNLQHALQPRVLQSMNMNNTPMFAKANINGSNGLAMLQHHSLMHGVDPHSLTHTQSSSPHTHGGMANDHVASRSTMSLSSADSKGEDDNVSTSSGPVRRSRTRPTAQETNSPLFSAARLSHIGQSRHSRRRNNTEMQMQTSNGGSSSSSSLMPTSHSVSSVPAANPSNKRRASTHRSNREVSRQRYCNPSILVADVGPKPLRILQYPVQKLYTMSKKNCHGMTDDELTQTVDVNVRVMGRPTTDINDLYVVAKDICLLVHVRKGNVAKTVAHFHSTEKVRMVVRCPRATGWSEHEVLVLTYSGVQRLLTNSRSLNKHEVLGWITAELSKIAEGFESMEALHLAAAYGEAQ